MSIEIRTAAPEDAGRLLEIYKYYIEETAITFEYEVPSVEEFAGRIRKTLKTYPYLVLLEDGTIMGYAYAGVFKGRAAYDWSCELSIYVDKAAHKCGYGRRLYEALEQELKEMGILNLYACIASPVREDPYLNRNSIDFHAHMGYELVGTFHSCAYKFHTWYDMVWMGKTIGEHQKDQPSVRPFGNE